MDLLIGAKIVQGMKYDIYEIKNKERGYEMKKIKQIMTVGVIAAILTTAVPIKAAERRLANCDNCGVGLMVEAGSNNQIIGYTGVTRVCLHYNSGLDHELQWTSQRLIKCNNCGFGIMDPVVNHYKWECHGYNKPEPTQ